MIDMDKEYTCPSCGEPCSPKKCDDGIGSYEFWGQKGYQSDPYLGSDCCEAFLDGAEWPEDVEEREFYRNREE